MRIRGKRGRTRVGGYSIIKQATTKADRRRIDRILGESLEGLILDHGPSETDLTTAQKLLIDGIISKRGVMIQMERYLARFGVFTKSPDNEEAQVRRVIEKYLYLSREIRADLLALGVKSKSRKPIDINAYLEEKRKKLSDTRREEGRDDSSSQGEIARPESNAAQESSQDEGESG